MLHRTGSEGSSLTILISVLSWIVISRTQLLCSHTRGQYSAGEKIEERAVVRRSSVLTPKVYELGDTESLLLT